MNKGNKQTTQKRYMLLYILILTVILIVSTIFVVKTYLSNTEKWSAKGNSIKNVKYDTHSILSQNLSSTEKNTTLCEKQATSVIDTLDAHSPDIICLQEASSDNVEDFATYFRSKNFDVVIKYADAINTSSAPIFYDSNKYSLLDSGYYWLSDTPTMSSPSWTENKPYLVTWVLLKDNQSSQEFGIVNTNLSKDTIIQEKSIDCIVTQSQINFKKNDYVLCGTFNFTNKDTNFSKITKNYTNLSSKANKLYNVGPTTTNNTADTSDDCVYDYFFGSENICCDRYAILKETVTEENLLYHYGVMCNIYLNENMQ